MKIDHDGRVITASYTYKSFSFFITNVYAPPNTNNRIVFFDNWTPQVKENAINIIAGDFNVNLKPETNRISQAAAQSDPSRNQLLELTRKFTNSAEIAGPTPFFTFHQNTQGGNMMATCLDYIFIDENQSHLVSKVTTHFGNSDHLLVNCSLNFNWEQKQSSSWRFDKTMFNNEKLKKEVLEEISEPNASENWDICKVYIQSIIRAFRKPKTTESKISKLNNKITKLSERIAFSTNTESLRSSYDELNIQLQEELSSLAEKWHIRSKVQWIEHGEKSTKYFFMKYKQRKSHTAHLEIKVPNSNLQNSKNICNILKISMKKFTKQKSSI